MKKTYSVSGMTCSACSLHVEKAAKSVEGVKSASVNLLENRLVVDSDDVSDDQIRQAVRAAGHDLVLGDTPRGGGFASPYADSAYHLFCISYPAYVCLHGSYVGVPPPRMDP